MTVEAAEAAALAAGVDEIARRRLRHVVSENERVRACVRALEAPGGRTGRLLGALFREGHASLRDDFEVSIPELDLLVGLAYEEGAVAARMTGGGSAPVVALADAGTAKGFARGSPPPTSAAPAARARAASTRLPTAPSERYQRCSTRGAIRRR